MMFLSIIETLFEALPQALLGLGLSFHQLKYSSIEDGESKFLYLWEAFPYQVLNIANKRFKNQGLTASLV